MEYYHMKIISYFDMPFVIWLGLSKRGRRAARNDPREEATMKVIAVAIAAIAITLFAGAADAQVQERTIRWGHLNNTDHPVSLGVQKFAEILAERRKAQGARVSGVAARQRDADAIGAARRHPGHDVRGDHIARERRQGIRSARLPFHRHHRGPGGRPGHRTLRASHARRPAREGSDR